MHMEWYSWEQVNQWHRYGIIINNLKCQIDLHHCDGLVETIEMDISFAYIRARMRYMHKTSCGPSGTHTRPHGDVLPHRRPRGHDTSPIKRSILSTNQEQAHGSKGPQPRDNGLETKQTPPYPPWDPPGSHLDENRHDRGHPEISWSPRSVEPTPRPLALPFHVLSCRGEPKVVPSVCPNIRLEACSSFSWKIHQLGPHSSAPHVTSSLVLWWCPRQPRELLLAYKGRSRG
jgi:hypothetical protein